MNNIILVNFSYKTLLNFKYPEYLLKYDRWIIKQEWAYRIRYNTNWHF